MKPQLKTDIDSDIMKKGFNKTVFKTAGVMLLSVTVCVIAAKAGLEVGKKLSN